METLHDDHTPLAAYIQGEGSDESDTNEEKENDVKQHDPLEVALDHDSHEPHAFAPSNITPRPRLPPPSLLPTPLQSHPPQSALTRVHHAWSTAWNARLGRAENAKFLEHFRYTIVASQLLNEYLDHGILHPQPFRDLALDGVAEHLSGPSASATIYGAAATAIAALALVYLIQWSRTRRGSASWSNSRVAVVLTVLVVAAFVLYQYGRRQRLKLLRAHAVTAASDLTTNWQAYELSSSSALSFIQEVELVSKGYRLSTPLPPISRIEVGGTARRCSKLRRILHKAYASVIPACIEACSSLGSLIDEDDLERYFDVYDISAQDAKEAAGIDALSMLEEDSESLKSLRVLSYRAGILRRATLCYLMALQADGGKPDVHRWKVTTDVMLKLNHGLVASAQRIRQSLSEMEHFNLPATPAKNCQTPTKEKIRVQVRKISALSSGIRGLQAKMQILREETNRSIEQSDDLTDLGPHLMAQYESIGTDIKELVRAWEVGKQSLQSNISRQEQRISLASSGLRSPVSSIGGLTAVEEVDGSPTEALRLLNGESKGSNRSSMVNTSEDEEVVFEAVAMPRQRASTLTREERIIKMHEERERQAQLRAKRDANTSMLRELESVINLRPKKIATGVARVTSL